MAKSKGKGYDDFAKFARKSEEPVSGVEGASGQEGHGVPEGVDNAVRSGTVVAAEVTLETKASEGVTHVVADSTEFEIDAEVADVLQAPPMTDTHVTFNTGRELPKVVAREGVNPLLVESYKTFRTLLASGLISPWANQIIEQIRTLSARLKKEVEGGGEG